MSKPNSHKAAFLGCGRVAQHYIKMLSEVHPVDGLECIAACDLDLAKAEALTAQLGGRAYTDYATMLAEAKPDLVFILTRSGDHVDHARQALEAGVHVISEKPIGLDPEAVRALAETADARGLMYGGVFQNRWNPAVRKLKEVYDSGRLGAIVSAAIRLRWCRPQDYYEDGWHGTWAQDGGVINQQAIHHVDAMNWICGPVEAVCAAAGNRANRLEAEDTLVATVRFESGALGTIEATTAARPEDFEASLSVLGDRGLIQIGGIALNKIDMWRFVETEEGDETVAERFSQEVPTGYGLGHGPYLSDLTAALDAGATRAPVSAQEAVAAVDLVHALYASIETGGWVRLADKPRSKKLGRGPEG